jgi:tetratricopeptide (TPR) repeat protein
MRAAGGRSSHKVVSPRRRGQDKKGHRPTPGVPRQATPIITIPKWLTRLRFPLVAAFLYGGLWPLMNVAFIAHAFPTPFLEGMAFFRRYSHMAGGPVQYAANLFSQTYSRHWAGVLAFTLLALAAWAIARGILRRFSSGSWNWPAAAFPGIFLILASRDLGVLFILPMVAGLAAAWLYMALCERPRNSWARRAVVVLFLIASIPLYYLLASGFLYFCAMCALFELLIRKRPVWSVAWIAVGAAVPYAVSYVYYEPDIVTRYIRWMMMPHRDALTTGLVAAMYLFVPVGAAAAFLIGRFRIGNRLAPRLRLAARVVGFAALALLASRLVALHLDKSGWVYADYLIDDGRPDEALASLAESPDDSDSSRFLTLYALGLTGRLPWEMFHYPQVASSDALLLRDTKWDTIPVVSDWRSDLYLELGRVNESQRWAHEALAVGGETPRVLERMALVYILDGNPDAAKTFLRALERVPFQAARARQYLTALDRDPGMRADPLVARIRPLMLRHDYVGTWSTEDILQQCLETNASNRMAFEYLLAHYLLTSDMEGLASLAPRLKDFYRELPTHVQEALLGYRNVNGLLPPGVDGSAINSQIESRFQSFISIYTRLQHGPAEDVWKALAPDFGATWWFFYIFDRTAAGPPFQPHAEAPQETGNP